MLAFLKTINKSQGQTIWIQILNLISAEPLKVVKKSVGLTEFHTNNYKET